jgi:hypothetical protein
MNKNQQYETLSEAVEDLKSRGYSYDFYYENACLYCNNLNKKFEASDLKITQVHRFEGASNPDDNDVLYAIESKDGHKGVLIDAYGVYADEYKSAFLSKIRLEENY